MVSAGFGAAFFLFLIFASLPVTPAGGLLGSTEYLEVDVRWSGDALLELVVETPDHQRVRLGHGVVEVQVEDGLVTFGEGSGGVAAWQAAYLWGASSHGQARLYSEADDVNHLNLRIIGPCPGEWRFGLNLNNVRDWSMLEPDDSASYAATAFTAEEEPEEGTYSAAGTVQGLDIAASRLGGEDYPFSRIAWDHPKAPVAQDAIVVGRYGLGLEHCQ